MAPLSEGAEPAPDRLLVVALKQIHLTTNEPKPHRSPRLVGPWRALVAARQLKNAETRSHVTLSRTPRWNQFYRLIESRINRARTLCLVFTSTSILTRRAPITRAL